MDQELICPECGEPSKLPVCTRCGFIFKHPQLFDDFLDGPMNALEKTASRNVLYRLNLLSSKLDQIEAELDQLAGMQVP